MNEVDMIIEHVEVEVIGNLETAIENMQKLLNEYNNNHKNKLYVVSVNNEQNSDGTYSFKAVDEYNNKYQLDVPVFLNIKCQPCITQLD